MGWFEGYLTNAKMSKEDILENYSHYGVLKKAFRVSKTDLKIRPIFRKQKRIEHTFV